MDVPSWSKFWWLITDNNSYPPDTEEKQKQLGEFFGQYPPDKVAAQLPDYVKALKEKDSSLTSFGIIGVRYWSHPLPCPASFPGCDS